MCHSSDYSQMIFEWLKLYRERSGKLCHEEMTKVFGGDFSKDGELGIGRGIWSRGFPETGLSGLGWRMSTSLGGCIACYICIVGNCGNYAVSLGSCFLGVLGILERSPCRGHLGRVLADNRQPRSTWKVIFQSFQLLSCFSDC